MMLFFQYIERVEKAEKELRDLRRENEQLRDDIRDFQRQVESQRDTMLAKRDEDFEFRDKITQKNKLLTVALEENRVSFFYLNI
jgi:centrosomal protein CEP290